MKKTTSTAVTESPEVASGREAEITELIERTGLRFPAHFESAFREDFIRRSLGLIRVGLVLGIILYSTFGVLDIFIAPLTRNLIWTIRFAVVSPVLAVTLALSWTRAFRRIMEPSMAVVALLSGFGIIAMIALSQDPDVTRYYYAGLILVIMWAYTFTKLRFATATVVCWIIVAGYQFTAIVIQDMTAEPELLVVLINNNFFFIAANILGMVVNYLMERYARRDFLNRLLIEEKQKLLAAERNELFERDVLIRQELELARRIQQHMIPQSQPDDRIFSMYKPMDEVGGDFYDFVRIPGASKVGVFLSDVSGHGVSAAFITSMIKTTVSQAERLAEDPAKMLSRLNSILVNQIDDRFVTALYGILDLVDRSFVYANAGHNPPFIITADGVRTLDLPRHHLPLGFIEHSEMAQRGVQYANYRTTLPETSKLLLYTDGLVEARSQEDHGEFFSDVLEEKLRELYGNDPRSFVQTLYQALVGFHGSEQFDDDICLICIGLD